MDPFFLLLSPHPTCRHFPNQHLTRCAFLATILTVSYSLSYLLRPTCPHSLRPTPYRSHHWHPHWHRTRHVVLYNLLLSVTPRAVITMSQSSPSYSPRLTCNHTHRVLLAFVLAAGTLIDIILTASFARSYSPRPTRYCSHRRHPH